MCKVLLNSVDKVKRFVQITSKVEGDVILKSGRYIIDAKSIMGIFSVDISNPVTLEFENCTQESLDEYMNSVKEFLV